MLYLLLFSFKGDSFDLDDLLGGLEVGSDKEVSKKSRPVQRPSTRHGEMGASDDMESGRFRKRADSDLFAVLDTQRKHNQPLSQTHTQGADILKLDSSPLHEATKHNVSAPTVGKQGGMEESFDDNDLLVDLGLGDDTSVKKKAGPTPSQQLALSETPTQRTRTSGINDTLFGGSGKPQDNTLDIEKKVSTQEGGEEEQDSFQFGGYVPTSTTPGRRKSSIRSNISEDSVDDSLLSRPNSAPTKKAVRFEESSLPEDPPRPSTSPFSSDRHGGEDSSAVNPDQPKQHRQRTASEVSFFDPSTRYVRTYILCGFVAG